MQHKLITNIDTHKYAHNLKAPVRSKRPLVGVLALAENAIGSKAYKPMDIIKSRKGTLVEVGNTDAEGRLALADGADRDCRLACGEGGKEGKGEREGWSYTEMRKKKERKEDRRKERKK